ncbi:ABC transporter ATP-binding protein [Butyricicoccus porcorum]|uniref:ABC-type quaternary amine transporter n=1 Tax=Butyricicoccus porcorum TaxID=1945634 RepID=A0A252F3K5_9FIRM|nr:ABC transporter ATP-binding protein [Butyricicoccus porcorum]MCI6927362.1 ABC transporter ATP-binding protein [Butyricicoccus porcorum]MDY4483751.1 ABC transporter ATP-binding protein [Butyricicoccus porcorum]OUM20271.1 ABC transporter ATP-binding protein [Butyricicoccus porcorum]
MAYIEFRNIDKFYGENHVLKNVNLNIEKGQFVTLLGPSGCGKSTLLRCLSGLEEISSGQIIMDGKDITGLEPKDRNIGMVFQHYSLFPNMTVEENIAFGLKMKKKPQDEIDSKVKEVMEMVELTGKEKAYPVSLSGGQQQRVALARSIVQQPKVLLLDEPLSAIDAKLRKALQQSIREVHKKLGLTSIFVTHDQDEAMVMSDTIHLFHDGKIEQSSDPIGMYTAPVSKFAATFIGNYNILSEEQFAAVTGKRVTAPEGIAIRPETLQFVDGETDEEYCFTGTIVDNTPKGNVLQYRVRVNGIILKVDVLFRSKTLFQNGNKVKLAVADHNCIRL